MSRLADALDDYLALRSSLGHQLAAAARLLPRFVAHLDSVGASTITIETALAWSMQPEVPAGSAVWANRMTAVRGFARYQAGFDPATQIPPVGLLTRQRHWSPPFLHSQNDIEVLLGHAGVLTPPMRAATYTTLIAMLAVTGMRIGEVIALDVGDVDLAAGVLHVRESKCGNSRLVPLHSSTTNALADYVVLRGQVRPRPRTPSLFVSRTRKRLVYQVAQGTFRGLCQAGGVGAGTSQRPRLHDLRHTFAVATLLDWYQAGSDVDVRLPQLSTYLGHRDPAYTYWYLSAAPDLLAQAAQRLENASRRPVRP